jgi:hypothetical protein
VHGDEVVDDLVDVGARVAGQRVSRGAVSAHVHAGLDGAHQRVALVLQVRLRDPRLQAAQRLLASLQRLRRLGNAVSANCIHTYIPLTLYPRRGCRSISDIRPILKFYQN